MIASNDVVEAVFLGVDTHLDEHAAVVLVGLGMRLGTASFPSTAGGYAARLRWAEGLGPVEVAGVEGTGCYGAGLARFLRAKGVRVLEVSRPKRRDRRDPGKSDDIDAELAARAILAGTVSGEAKGGNGRVEAIRALRASRRSAVKARTQAANQLKALLVTAPEGLRERLRRLTTAGLVEAAARLRPGPRPSDPEEATKLALRSVARRHLALSEEVAESDAHLGRLVAEAAPELLKVHGVGVETAATLLIAAGDNPERLKSEASFAHLCGTAPVPASSGKTVRHRLNRQGNRDANRALYIVALSRMSRDERTRAYVARRMEEGKSKREIVRCLQRYIVREIYRVLAALTLSAVPVRRA